MTVMLPDSMRSNLEQTAATRGFSSVDAYLIFLVLERLAEEVEDEDDAPDFSEFVPSPGASYVFNSREELEVKLAEALESGPPVRMTPDFWVERRKALAERLANRARGHV